MNQKPSKILSSFTLSMIAVAAIVSLRNLPLMAVYGFGSIFFYAIAGLAFFIPAALVAAELATAWPKTGGLYVWVSEAFGNKYGFLAVWLEWVMNMVWNPTVLSFLAATFAYLIDPNLVNNRYFMIGTMLIVFWGITFINFLGMRASGLISSIGVISGTIIPGLIMILLACTWLLMGKPSQIEFSTAELIPSLKLDNIVFFAGVLLGLAGIEVAAFHASEAKDPKKDYPKAIFYAAIIILTTLILGTLSIAIVVPAKKISLVAGLMEAVSVFFDSFHLSWATNIFGGLVIIGALAMLSTWIAGPSHGMLASARSGDIPSFMQKVNKKGMPINIFFIQATIATILSMVFLLMPNVNASYWILTALTAQLTTLIYILMFSAAIYLRYSKPDIERPYKVPFGNIGMWIIGGLGCLTSLFALFIGFIPPKQLDSGSIIFYECFLIFGILIFSSPPFIFAGFKKNKEK